MNIFSAQGFNTLGHTSSKLTPCCRRVLRVLQPIVLFLVCTAVAQAMTPAPNQPAFDHAKDTSINDANGGALAIPTQDFPFTLTTSANPAQVDQPVDLVAAEVGFDSGTVTISFIDSAGSTTPLCANVTTTAVGSQEIAHCVATFTAPGDHELDAQFTNIPAGDVIPQSDILDQNVVASVAFDANQFPLTGSWYNPATAGLGLELAAFPDASSAGEGTLFGGWFTFDGTGNQQWVTLQGNLSSSHGATYDLGIYVNTGGAFAAPPITTAAPDGTATLTFYDCTDAALTYTFSDGRTGTIPYVRLSDPTGCSSAVPATAPMPLLANDNDVLHSGAWFDPATSDQGMNVDVIPSQTTFFAIWYTYAPVSEGQTGVAAQRWFTLQTNAYTPGDLSLANVPIYTSTGGVFNTPSAVTTTQVGTANVTFTSCTAMTLDYTFTSGEFQGQTGSIDEQNPMPAAGCQ